MAGIAAGSGVPLGDTVPDRLAAVCSAFEAGWQSGDRPSLEEYLQRSRPDDRTALLSLLIRIEVRQRLRRGETPRPEEYATRFPQDQATVLSLDWASLASPDALARATGEYSTLILPKSARPKLGRFELVERVGIGGFGEVWRAHDPHLDREVAVKVSHFTAAEKTRADLLLHEARSAGRLKHPGIVPVHEAAIDGNTAYIVSDFIPGTTLADRIKSGPMPFHEAAELVRKLALAVAHAHDRGVVHRDIKPANVLLDRSGEPHLTDFGIARRAAGDKTISHAGQALGTPAYMSPEQAKGEVTAVDHRTDVYAIGVLLYEMLAGRRAFPGDAREALQRVLLGPPQRLKLFRKDVPRDLETIVTVAISRDRGDRYQTAQALADDLGRYLDGEPIVARRRSVLERIGRTLRRRPVIVAAPALIALAAVAWSTTRPDTPPPGTRLVSMTTIPPGAEMTFVPLDPTTGEPQPERMRHPGKSPVEVVLEPGDYLVVAVLADGRFHEVYRRVPGPTSSLPGSYGHNGWSFDEDGRVVLRPPRIPEASVVQSMAWIEGSMGASFGMDNSHDVPKHKRSISAFWMDPTEFTWDGYRQLTKGREPKDLRITMTPGDHPATLSFDEVLNLAESAGKRLPTEFELEYVAAMSDSPLPGEWRVPSPVREPAGDRIETTPPVYGLRSNVAEWTSSWASYYPGGRPPGVASDLIQTPDHRIVRGGSSNVINGGDSISSDEYHPRRRSAIHRREIKPGLGVRFVRSAKPRFQAKDFPDVVLESRSLKLSPQE